MEKSGKLEIYRNTFLEKEELDRFTEFNSNGLLKLLLTKYAKGFGIINTNPEASDNDSFKVSKGTDVGTISIAADSYAINNKGDLIRRTPIDNIEILDSSNAKIIDEWVWVKIKHVYDKFEEGILSVDINGNVSGTGTKFTDVLRGGASGFPTYIKFINSTVNNGLYEVSTVINDISAILSGDFTPESNLKYVVYGTFALGKSQDALSSEGIYSYDSTEISFVKENVDKYPPKESLVDGEEFFIARARYDSSTNAVTIQDKRAFIFTDTDSKEEVFNYYYKLNSGLTGLSDTGWLDCINPSNLPNFNIKVRQIGKMVNILGDMTSIWKGTSDLFSVPSIVAKTPQKTGIYSLLDDGSVGLKSVTLSSKSDGKTWETIGSMSNSSSLLINITYFTE